MATKISLIITAKNESESISRLLDSIAKQTRRPDEIIISDANSTDQTWAVARAYGMDQLTLLGVGNVNRAVGRNQAIEAAKYEHILITDAGCRLKETWVEEMAKGFENAQVVAGFYEGEYANIFEQCELPYVLVMPDKIDTKHFLPATRSMGITKTAWKKAGKFNEKFRYAEDYEFARRIAKLGMTIQVVPSAIVYWRPRKNLQTFARMIYEHAYGDGYSKTFRPKVLTIYLRYALLATVGMYYGPWIMVPVLAYVGYAIQKNYRYVKHPKALVYLPLLQVVSDFAVMWGTLSGSLGRHLKYQNLQARHR